jgi:acid phosphatase
VLIGRPNQTASVRTQGDPTNMGIRKSTTAALAAVAVTSAAAALAAHPAEARKPAALPGGYQHLVVIYEENHSFDNLYGLWGKVGGESVDGLPADAVPQVAQDGTPFGCLLQKDVNLTTTAQTTVDSAYPAPGVHGPLAPTCTDAAHAAQVPSSHFPNAPYQIDDYVGPDDNTCPPGTLFAPDGLLKNDARAETEGGGCTRDLVHRFYSEQFQIDGGKQDRYVLGSDAAGLTMGYYDTKTLPIYEYLHSKGAPHYVVADHFFQAAFGGSFLNHQFLIAARAPLDADPTIGTPNATGTTAINSRLDSNGMATGTPLYTPTGSVVDK